MSSLTSARMALAVDCVTGSGRFHDHPTGGVTGELERHHRQHEPGRVGGALASRLGGGWVLQVDVDLFDGGVGAVGLSAMMVSKVLMVKNAWTRQA
jgi:hypothetical protein